MGLQHWICEEMVPQCSSVKSGGVVNIGGNEGGFSLSANSVIPHPPYTALSVSGGSPTLTAGVAAVGAQSTTLN